MKKTTKILKLVLYSEEPEIETEVVQQFKTKITISDMLSSVRPFISSISLFTADTLSSSSWV